MDIGKIYCLHKKTFLTANTLNEKSCFLQDFYCFVEVNNWLQFGFFFGTMVSMIEVLKSEPIRKKRWFEQYWVVGAAAFLVAAIFGIFATMSVKKSEVNIEVISTLMDLEENRTVSAEKRQEAAVFLGKNGQLLSQSIAYFLDEPSLIEQATKKSVVPFTQVTRLIAEKHYKEALQMAEAMQHELSTPLLQSINLLRIMALQHELKIDDHNRAWDALKALEASNPDEVRQVLTVYQVGNISLEDLFHKS